MGSPDRRSAPPNGVAQRASPGRRVGAAICVVATLIGPFLSVVPAEMAAATTVGSADRDVSAADAALASARTTRSAAEARVADLTQQLAAVDADLQGQSAGAVDVARDLEDARHNLRVSAITAFVSNGDDDALLQIVSGRDLADDSARRVYAASRTVDWSDAQARLEELKAENDPKLVAASQRREALAARLANANDAVLQASAVESDAERQVTRARERAAEARAAAAAAAAAAPTTTKPAPVATPGAGSGIAAPTPAAPSNLTVVPHDEPSAPLPDVPLFGPTPEQWARLRQCESGGNYRAVSRSGTYRGAYQFDQRTWEVLGGRGDPAAAPPIEQDARAAVLYSQRGARPWPVCGRALGS